MTGLAETMMTVTMGVIILFTGYFFRKVLKTPPRPEEGSEPVKRE